ncbi:hypothetical protein SAMN04488688_101894 [Paenibacillus sp. cl141a]|nr:hypothetical protein SAMN04488688_101894 [Paenibacillus sp. cl141a]
MSSVDYNVYIVYTKMGINRNLRKVSGLMKSRNIYMNSTE